MNGEKSESIVSDSSGGNGIAALVVPIVDAPLDFATSGVAVGIDATGEPVVATADPASTAPAFTGASATSGRASCSPRAAASLRCDQRRSENPVDRGVSVTITTPTSRDPCP